MENVSSLPSLSQSLTRHHFSCRKEKSLGLLCTNFLSLYNRDDVKSIELGNAAQRLGVVKRRIYDIVNILESLGVLTRKGKNEYSWNGLDGVPRALNALKEQALREKKITSSGATSRTGVLDDNGDEQSCDSNNASRQDSSSTGYPLHIKLSSKQDNKRERCLLHLTENFVKLLLFSNNKLISLDEAAKILLGNTHNPSDMRNKVRRLYDIANILCSIRLIEKTQYPESKKPAFRWLGINGTPENGSLMSRKRAFGTEITNTFKRNKMVTLGHENTDHKTEIQMQIKCEDFASETNNKLNQPQQSKHSPKGVVYSPFCPLRLPKDDDTVMKNVNRFQDWESLASSYHPQYHNQALGDLFAHYVEAWKSWYVEVIGKEPIQLL